MIGILGAALKATGPLAVAAEVALAADNRWFLALWSLPGVILCLLAVRFHHSGGKGEPDDPV